MAGGLRRELPAADLASCGQPGDTAPADYAVVWRPPAELLAAAASLRADLHSRRGRRCDSRARTRQPGTLPADAQLIRLEDYRHGAQMAEYATHAALRYCAVSTSTSTLQRQQAVKRAGKCSSRIRARPSRSACSDSACSARMSPSARGVRPAGARLQPQREDDRRRRTFAGAAQFDAFLDGVKVLVNLLPAYAGHRRHAERATFSNSQRGAYLSTWRAAAIWSKRICSTRSTSGQLAAATLDVFRDEPLPQIIRSGSEPRVTITPHMSALTLREESVEQVARKIKALVRGETISGVVDSSAATDDQSNSIEQGAGCRRAISESAYI